MTGWRNVTLLTTGAMAAALLGVPVVAHAGTYGSYASIRDDGSPMSAAAHQVLSASGRYVAWGGTQVPADFAYWRDTLTGVSQRIDIATDGTDPGLYGDGAMPLSITDDGRYVLFSSQNPSMVPNDTPLWRLFVRDTTSDTTTEVVLGDAATPANDAVEFASMSGDGRYIAFVSAATNLLPGGSQGSPNVYEHDTVTGANILVSVTTDGLPPNGSFLPPSVSGDGRYVAFSTQAGNMVTGDTYVGPDVFLRDILSQTTTLVSRPAAGAQNGASSTNGEALSSDGRYVVFDSDASNLVSGDTDAAPDVFRYDRDTAALERVSALSSSLQGGAGGSVSADGARVAFSSSTAFDPADVNGKIDVYVRDMGITAIRRVSRNSAGGDPNGDSVGPVVSGDGASFAYTTQATNIDAGYPAAGLIVTTPDLTAPSSASNLTGKAGNGLVQLAWTNPADNDFHDVVVRKATGTTPPASPTSGTAVYTGAGSAVTATGLTNGTAYSFSVFARDAAGNAASPVTLVGIKPHAPLATSLKIATSASTVAYGAGFSVRALLLDNAGHALAGEPVKFYIRRKGTTAFTLLGSQITGSDGKTTRTVKPAWNAEVTLRHDANAFWAASASPNVVVYVRPALTVGVTNPTALLGTASAIRGTLNPAHYGQVIYLQQFYSSAWHNVSSTKLGSTGGYAFGVRPSSSASLTYRVYKPADSDHLAAVTGSVRVTRYVAKIASIHYDAAGDDRYNLNDEYLVLTNTGHVTINLSGWRLYAGDSTQNFTLPLYGLGAGASVRIRTGSGTSGGGNIFLGYGKPIWNNSGGDTAILYDNRGAVVSKYTY